MPCTPSAPHATYLVEQRGAHYLFTVRANQKKLARQLQSLPWKDIPVIHRDDTAGHGRQEQRHVQVVTVNSLLFPHARQVLRIQRKRRTPGVKRWSTETVYAITDLPAEQASAAEIAAWARGHWTVENTVHWCRDVTFNEDKSQVRAHNTPAVLASETSSEARSRRPDTSTSPPPAAPTLNAPASSPTTASRDRHETRQAR